MESEKSEAALGFATAAEADRRVAGVAWAARLAGERATRGARRVRLHTGDGLEPAPATLADIERLRAGASVEWVADGPTVPAPAPPSSWSIVRTTGKPGDGLVSRWLNRPVSQRISWLLLHLPGVRPVHVTAFNAALALAMAMILLGGGQAGLIVGAILFHLASVLDGVDGEMARATGRSSAAGASLDSMVDMATNFLFVSGLTIHLAFRDGGAIGWLGAAAIGQMLIGNALLARQARAGGAPVGFDLLKRRRHDGGLFGQIYWAVQTLTGRDCFAFLFMLLTLAGLERVALFIFFGVGTVWLGYILVTQLAGFRAYRNAA